MNEAEAEARAAAQRWHQEQMGLDEAHEQHSSCWCCCISCDPDWFGVPAGGNPFYAAALQRD